MKYQLFVGQEQIKTITVILLNLVITLKSKLKTFTVGLI